MTGICILHGFSRNTIWPLFHYFTEHVTYSEVSWKAYVKINRLYAEKILEIVKDGDILWIHDYHLMMLPQMIREQKPGYIHRSLYSCTLPLL